MKKLLILAYDFPPYVSVGGLRPYNWYRYLKEYDIEPIVITRQWSNAHGNHLDYIAAGSSDQDIVEEGEFGTIIRTPYHPNFANRLMLKHGEQKYRILRKSVSAYYEFAQFLAPVGTKAGLYEGARAYLKTNKVDAIIATGDPFVLFSYASKLSKEFGIPWIADYRDPWSQGIEIQKKILLKYWSRFFEKKITKTASLICTANDFFKKHIESLIKAQNIIVIANGYSEYSIDSSKNTDQKKDVLTIAFAGTIYKWHPIKRFIQSSEEFLTQHENRKLDLVFYGINNQPEIEDFLNENYPQRYTNIVFHEKISNEVLGVKMAQHNVFLLFNDYSIIGTKIYTYIGLKRKILFCFSHDQEANTLKEQFFGIPKNISIYEAYQADLINETNSGIIVKDSNHLQQVLQELYTEFEEKGFIACDSVGVENYSRKIQVERLAELVKEIGG